MQPRSTLRYRAYRDRSRQRPIVSLLRFLALFLLVYLIITGVFLRSIRIDSAMMAPTIEPGDRLFVSPLIFGPRIRAFGWVLPGLREPKRGDIVTLRPSYMPPVSVARRLFNPLVRIVTFERVRLDEGDSWQSANQVKRIIALPGDTVRMERFVAYVKPAGKDTFQSELSFVEDEYEVITDGMPEGWQSDDPFGSAAPERVLGDNEYFVLGDDRVSSIDSRHWGPVRSDSIQARVVFRFWPPGRTGSP